MMEEHNLKFPCPWCQNPVELSGTFYPGDKFTCPACGETLPVPAELLHEEEKSVGTCPHCGGEAGVGDVKCGHCGKEIDEILPAPGQDELKEPADGAEKPGTPVEGINWVSPSTGMKFVWMPAMGIWAGKYEVTNDEYRGKEPDHFSGEYRGFSLDGPRQPVVEVTFEKAKKYAEWMSVEDEQELSAGRGYRYRLPSEDEWLKLAECGDGRRYPWGNDWPPVSGHAGNYRDETAKKHFPEAESIPGYDDGHAVSAPVDELWANPWGLCGVGGNVWEACATDCSGEHFGAWRGADWHSSGPGYLRCSYRDETGKSERTYAINYTSGFRLVMSPRRHEVVF